MIEGFLVILCFLRSGNLVIAVVPKKTRVGFVRTAVIGIVMCVWRGHKKPKLSTQPMSIGQVVAARVCQLVPKEAEGISWWQCTPKAESWIVRPEALVAILEFEEEETFPDRLILKLAHQSVDLARDLPHIPDWWPQLPDGGQLAELFLPRVQRRKKKVAEPAEPQPEGDATGASAGAAIVQASGEAGSARKKVKKDKKIKKDKKKTEKPTDSEHKILRTIRRSRLLKKMEEIPFSAENLTKSQWGDRLIKQELKKLKDLDANIFQSNPLFDPATDACRVKATVCQGTSLADIMAVASEYFKKRYLGLLWIIWVCFFYFDF